LGRRKKKKGGRILPFKIHGNIPGGAKGKKLRRGGNEKRGGEGKGELPIRNPFKEKGESHGGGEKIMR